MSLREDRLLLMENHWYVRHIRNLNVAVAYEYRTDPKSFYVQFRDLPIAEAFISLYEVMNFSDQLDRLRGMALEIELKATPERPGHKPSALAVKRLIESMIEDVKLELEVKTMIKEAAA